jgi:phage shock protein A
MYLYSVTIHIQKAAEQEWLEFMQQKHIADVLDKGYFTKASMRKVMNGTDENSVVYNIEYSADSIEHYEAYAQLAAPALQKDVSDRFAGKFTAQRAFYQIVFEL